MTSEQQKRPLAQANGTKPQNLSTMPAELQDPFMYLLNKNTQKEGTMENVYDENEVRKRLF